MTTEERLAELLRVADAPPLPAAPGLAQRVLREARARVHRRQFAAATLVVISGGAAAVWMNRVHSPSAPAPMAHATSASPSPAMLARLKSDAEIHSTVANALRAREFERRLRVPDIVATAELERDKAALAMLDHGDRLRRDLKQVDAALAAYRRTIVLFPDTRWSAVAKQRIAQLDPGARRTQPDHTLT